MKKTIPIPLDEAVRVLRFLEKAHDLMHQPMTYRSGAQVEAFVEANYSEVRDLYYGVVWGWLPAEVRADLQDDDGGRSKS